MVRFLCGAVLVRISLSFWVFSMGGWRAAIRISPFGSAGD